MIEGNTSRMEGADNLSDHPYLTNWNQNFKPPDADSVDPRELRELVRRLIIEQNDFSQKQLQVKKNTSIAEKNPEGITVGEVRIALDSTRKCPSAF